MRSGADQFEPTYTPVLYHHTHIVRHASDSHKTLSKSRFSNNETNSQKEKEPDDAERGSCPWRIQNQGRTQADSAAPRQGASTYPAENFHALRTQQEGLRADVRIEAERKLKALEADLAAGERANKERALATRYHKVKFFGACHASYRRP